MSMVRASSCVLAVSLALPSLALAQASLIDGLGGPVDFGAGCLGPNDDGSSRAIDLTPVFPSGIQFFDRTHSQMFVNTNGNVTFGGGLAAFSPRAFPVANQPMIAPYWADVDIRAPQCSLPEGGSGYAGDCQEPADNGVWWQLDPDNDRVVVTWHEVGYYNCAVGSRMSFQLILTAAEGEGCGDAGGGSDFDVEFRFERCEWNTGDASGGRDGFARDVACTLGIICPLDFFSGSCVGGRCQGIAAQAGFDAGNERDFVEVMGSRTNTIHTIMCESSNVGEPGVWRYQIRSGVVICPGAGEPCDTGLPGVCAAGRTRCVADGIECQPELTATEERCDGLDNDCDGQVDEGSDLCPGLEVCDQGRCVGACFEGACVEGQVCTDAGFCVDEGCEDVTCGEGQRCRAGSCVEACEGVVCPAGRQCRAGRCVDLCADATCDDCTVCDAGDCIPRCDFEPCPAGQTCLADGRCVESACAEVDCPAGQVCAGGTCVDACLGAVCPVGDRCEVGECVPEPRPEPMPRPDAGPPPPPPDGGPRVDAGALDAGLPPLDGGRMMRAGEASACICRAGPGRDRGGASLPLALVGFVLLALRRRRST